MNWRDRVTDSGKFRGAVFFAERSNLSGGRRNVVHEFPLRDKPFIEDLGRKVKAFSLSVFVLGDDYMDARDALIDALDQVGAGTLIHPWFGSLRVVVLDYDVSESTDRGGMATFNISFSEAGDVALPVSSVDTAMQVEVKADAVLAKAEDDFLENFSLSELPGYAIDQVSDYVNEVLPELQTALDFADTAYQAAENVRAEIVSFQANINTLIHQPLAFANRFTGLASSLLSVVSTPFFGIRLLQSLFKLGNSKDSPQLFPVVSSSANAPRQAVATLISEVAIAVATQSSAVAEFDNKDQALDLRDELVEQLDSISLASSDQQYQAIATLQAAINLDLSTRGAQLPALSSHTVKTVLPALVVAHRVHYDIVLEDDIVLRNNIRHPGFVAAGELEVLNG